MKDFDKLLSWQPRSHSFQQRVKKTEKHLEAFWWQLFQSAFKTMGTVTVLGRKEQEKGKKHSEVGAYSPFLGHLFKCLLKVNLLEHLQALTGL